MRGTVKGQYTFTVYLVGNDKREEEVTGSSYVWQADKQTLQILDLVSSHPAEKTEIEVACFGGVRGFMARNRRQRDS